MHTRTFVLVLVCGVAAARADWKDDVGYTSLQLRLGAATPDGTGIAVTQTEALDAGNYLPDPANAEFAGKTITAKSGAGGASGHATTVGRYYYGLVTSVAPAISAVDAYEANNWLSAGFLRFNTISQPLTETRRAQNHSWIGSYGNDAYDNDVLRRVDLVVQRDGVLVAVGVNNGATTPMPELLSSAYNVLAVGLTSGASSPGPTLAGIDGAGRVKPDIVAPLTLTSWATPVVAACGALLLETADANDILPELNAQQRRAGKAVLAKALLMAGATKAECAGWRKGFATPSTDGTVPLDYRYGAGELNIDNSHRILTAGRYQGGTTADVGKTGWDYAHLTSGGSRQYFFEVPAGSYADRVSILAAWNRQITVGGGNPLNLTPSLPNVDLRLYQAVGFAIGAQVDASVSTIDNVEHVHLADLPAGRYAIEIASNLSCDVALAWDLHLAAVNADFDGDGDVDLADFAAFQSCFNGPNRPLPAACTADADFDNDADADLTDFGAFQGCFNGPNRPPQCGEAAQRMLTAIL